MNKIARWNKMLPYINKIIIGYFKVGESVWVLFTSCVKLHAASEFASHNKWINTVLDPFGHTSGTSLQKRKVRISP